MRKKNRKFYETYEHAISTCAKAYYKLHSVQLPELFHSLIFSSFFWYILFFCRFFCILKLNYDYKMTTNQCFESCYAILYTQFPHFTIWIPSTSCVFYVNIFSWGVKMFQHFMHGKHNNWLPIEVLTRIDDVLQLRAICKFCNISCTVWRIHYLLEAFFSENKKTKHCCLQ